VPIPSGTAPCRAAQLEGRYLGAYDVTGIVNRPIALRNTGSTACYLNGVPDLTILDSRLTVEARVAGTDGVGTQFDAYVSAVDILMAVGTPSLSDSGGFLDSASLPPGQAYLNIKWTGCSLQPASRLWVDLPNGGGRVVVRFAVAAPDLNTCTHDSPLVRDPFKPTGVVWPPAPDTTYVAASIDAPATVKPGTTLEYLLTLHNSDQRDYVLAPCPDYGEAIENGPVAYYQLNCGPVGTLKAGQSVTFQMKFDIPADTAPGDKTLLWSLIDGRVYPARAEAPITITA
jgi:hypothetical protein